jgi:hypothetical protein
MDPPCEARGTAAIWQQEGACPCVADCFCSLFLKARAQFSAADRRNTLLQILRGTQAAPEAVGLSVPLDTVALKQVSVHCTLPVIRSKPLLARQDVNVYVSEAEAGFVQTYSLRSGRQIYFICAEGQIMVNGVSLAARDAARISTSLSADSIELQMKAGPEGAHM